MSSTSPTPTEVPDGITPIRALRCWKLVVIRAPEYEIIGHDVGSFDWISVAPARAELRSTAMAECWTSGVMAARCQTWGVRSPFNSNSDSGHVVPQADCQCGLYATRDISHLWSEIARHLCHVREVPIFGEVDLWGRVAEHEWGWRAQYARIVKLYDTPELTPDLDLGGLPIAPMPALLRALIDNHACGRGRGCPHTWMNAPYSFTTSGTTTWAAPRFSGGWVTPFSPGSTTSTPVPPAPPSSPKPRRKPYRFPKDWTRLNRKPRRWNRD